MPRPRAPHYRPTTVARTVPRKRNTGDAPTERQLAEAAFDATRVARLLRAADGSLRVALVNLTTGREFQSLPLHDRSPEALQRVMGIVGQMRERLAEAAALARVSAAASANESGPIDPVRRALDAFELLGAEHGHRAGSAADRAAAFDAALGALTGEEYARFREAVPPREQTALDELRYRLVMQAPRASDVIAEAPSAMNPAEVVRVIFRGNAHDDTHWLTITDARGRERGETLPSRAEAIAAFERMTRAETAPITVETFAHVESAPPLDFTPTAWQEARIALYVGGTFRSNRAMFKPGYLPLRADAHPDGRVRVVFVATEISPAMVDPGKKMPDPGRLLQIVLYPTKEETITAYGSAYETSGERASSFDEDPAWRTFRDVRWAPPDDKPHQTFAKTLEDFLDATKFKAPAKLREIRVDHWRLVAGLLHYRRPVTAEVLADYPWLAQFYAENLVAAKTLAELRAERDVSDNPADPDLTLSWSAKEGLLLTTRGKEERIIAAVHAIRRHGSGHFFKWSRNIGSHGAYYRPQSVGVSYSTTDIDRVVNHLRDEGMVVAVVRSDVAQLGEANARRQEHKFWRAEGYAGRAERGLDRADEREARATQIREDLPVGAPTRRAERAEARAEGHEARAAEHLEYVAHAASAAGNLAATAAGYDTTAELTRKQAERRTDAFGTLLVRRGKGLVGATEIGSKKTSNVSEYRVRWWFIWPPSAQLAASVEFDGRVIEVKTPAGIVLREDVTQTSPEDVFARVIDALPKYTVDASAHAPEDPQTFVEELSLYASKRSAQIGKAIVNPARGTASVWKAGYRYGRSSGWQPMEVHEGALSPGDSGSVRWTLAPIEGRGLVCQLSRFLSPLRNGGTRAKAVPDGFLDLDFTGLTIADAWELLLAGFRAIASGTPLAAPARKAPRKPGAAPSITHGHGRVETVARDLSTAPQRVAHLRAELAPLTAEASERLTRLRGRAEGAQELKGTLDAARGAGNVHGFYPTAPSLAEYLVERAGVGPGDTVLEPEAGMGGLVAPLVTRGAAVTAIELHPDRAAYLAEAWGPRGVSTGTGDFLALRPDDPRVPPGGFDFVVMNPPFSTEASRYTDAQHALHALAFVKPGGVLAAIMSPASRDPNSVPRRMALHRALAGWDVTWEPVEPGRFRLSGTEIPTVILLARHPKANRRPLPRRR